MTSTVSPTQQSTEIFYPSSDGEPLAETYFHIDAIINTVVILKQHLANQQAIVLSNQFLYYAQGFPKLRVAPDVMVIFDVPLGGRDNYKIWEEGQVPSVIFEMTSAGTRQQDETFKKELYEGLEVQEYWQFDPQGDWIPEKLRGFRLQGDSYTPITDNRSTVLELRFEIAAESTPNFGDVFHLLFYREDTGERLLAPMEMMEAIRQEVAARQEAESLLQEERQRAEQESLRAEQERERAEQERERAEQAEAELDRLRAQIRSLGGNPD